MASTWPSTLPSPTIQGYVIKPKDKSARTDFSVGLPRARQRSAARVDFISVLWVFTDAQMTIFRDWYANDLRGASWFRLDLISGEGGIVPVDARFNESWVATLLPGLNWQVVATLECTLVSIAPEIEPPVSSTNVYLVVSEASHAQVADNVTLSPPTETPLVVSEASHAQAADNVTLTIPGTTLADMPTLSFTNATGSVPVMTGLCFKKGKAFGDLTTNIPGLYVTVKRAWNDGSAKHAILSGIAPANTQISIAQGLAGGTPLTHANIVARAPTAHIAFSAYGTFTLTAAMAAGPHRTWISTPGMVECHYKLPVTGTLMYVWFHVRLWSDGSCWVRAIAEYPEMIIPDVTYSTVYYTYDAEVVIDGAAVDAPTLTGYTHYQLTGWAKHRWLGSTQHDVWPVHDTDYMQETGLVPTYGFGTGRGIDEADRVSEFTLSWEPGTVVDSEVANWRATFPGTGYGAQIGLLPDWDAKYLITGDTRGYRCIMVNLYAALHFPMMYREPASMEILMPSDNPTGNLYSTGQSGGVDRLGIIGFNQWDYAHGPSMGYMAYLVSGDYLGVDVMLGNVASIYQAPMVDMDYTGLERRFGLGSTRGTAWSFRTVGQAAGILPVDHRNYDDMRVWLRNNVSFWRSKSIDDPLATDSELGIPATMSCDGPLDNSYPLTVQMWMHAFWTAAMGYISDLDPQPVADLPSLTGLRDWMYRFAVGEVGTIAGWCYTYAGKASFTPGGVMCDYYHVYYASELYMTWAEAFAASYDPDITVCGNTIINPQTAGGYIANWIPAIQYALKHSATGALIGWARFIGADNYALPTADWSTQTPWSVKFPIDPPPAPPDDWPSWRTAMSANTWDYVGTNTLASIDPEDNAAINPNYPADAVAWHGISGQYSVMTSWSGAVWMEGERRLRIFGGGHENYGGNEVYDWDSQTATYVLRTWPTGAIGNEYGGGALDMRFDGLTATGLYFDGQPRSRHSYNLLTQRQGITWAFGGSMYGETPTFYTFPCYFTGTSWVTPLNQDMGLQYGGICYDSLRDRFWGFRQANGVPVKYYDPVANTITQVAKNVDAGYGEIKLEYVAAFDAIVYFGANGVKYFLPATLQGLLTPTITGTAPTFTGSAGKAGIAWDEANKRFLIWVGTTTIYTLTLGAAITDPWAWGTLPVAPGNTVTPSAPTSNGTYGRFWYSPYLQCCGVVNGAGENMYVYALS